MTSWDVWAVTVAVSGLIGFTATHYSVRTLRYVTAGTVIVLLVVVTAYGQTPSGGRGRAARAAARGGGGGPPRRGGGRRVGAPPAPRGGVSARCGPCGCHGT